MRTIGSLIAGTLLTLGLVSPAVAKVPRHYRVIDVGALGGTQSQFNNFDQFLSTPNVLDDAGQLAVTTTTATGNPLAALYSAGTLTALAGLPNASAGGGGSYTQGLNARGVVVGAADDGTINSFNGAPFDHPVYWDRGGVHRLQELAGHAGYASFVSDDGIIVGYSNTADVDTNTYAGLETRGVVWRNGAAQALGTLGGNTGGAIAVNRCHGQPGVPTVIIGQTALDNVPTPPYGFSTVHAVAWVDGTLTDLGTLGGNFSTPSQINCRGQVAVIAFDSSNASYQSFVWSGGKRVLLQKLGGSFVEANALNDGSFSAGGVTDASDATFIAAVWDASGHGRELGTIGGDAGSMAFGINDDGIVVGASGVVSPVAVTYAHAFVAGPGGAATDLNTLVPADSPLALHVAYAINARGEIAGLGTNAAGQTHAFILVPDDCDAPMVTPRESGRGIRAATSRRIGESLRRAGYRTID